MGIRISPFDVYCFLHRQYAGYMNPLKPTLDILYRFEKVDEGIKIVPTHYLRWYAMCCIPPFIAIFFAYLLSFVTDNTMFGAIIAMIAFIPMLISGVRVNFQLRDTFAYQVIHSLTIENGFIKMQISPNQGGIKGYFGIRTGVIEKPIEIPIESIVKIEMAYEELKWDTYYSLVATVLAIDEEGADELMDLKISPRFRKEKDVHEFHSRIEEYISLPESPESSTKS